MGTCLLSDYLAAVWGYAHTDTQVSSDQFHNHHIKDTTLLPNMRNTNEEKAQSHTYKPMKHILHKYKTRENPKYVHQ
jgi:hypothetical protein